MTWHQVQDADAVDARVHRMHPQTQCKGMTCTGMLFLPLAPHSSEDHLCSEAVLICSTLLTATGTTQTSRPGSKFGLSVVPPRPGGAVSWRLSPSASP